MVQINCQLNRQFTIGLKYMDTIKKSRRDNNIEKVINIALDFFIKYGIENSKVKDIAEAANLTERSLFRYFSTKADLVLQTALLFWSKIVDRVNDNFENNITSNATGIEKIRYVINQYLDLYFTAREELIFVQEAEVYLHRCGKSDLVNNKPPAPFKDNAGPLAHAINDGIKDGTVKNNKNISLIYYNTYDLVLGMMQKMAISENNLIDEEKAKQRIELLVDSIIEMYSK